MACLRFDAESASLNLAERESRRAAVAAVAAAARRGVLRVDFPDTNAITGTVVVYLVHSSMHWVKKCMPSMAVTVSIEGGSIFDLKVCKGLRSARHGKRKHKPWMYDSEAGTHVVGISTVGSTRCDRPWARSRSRGRLEPEPRREWGCRP